MNREILFRGKRTDNGEWVEGSVVYYKHIASGACQCFGDCDCIKTKGKITESYQIITESGCKYRVIPETVGQFTGLTDNSGTKIFEGDIVECDMTGHTMQRAKMRGIVKFNDGCFDVEFKTPFVDKNMGCNRFRDYVKCFVCNSAIEVIGNIHDHQHLLKGDV